MVLENGLSFPSSFILLALSGADDLGLEGKCQKADTYLTRLNCVYRRYVVPYLLFKYILQNHALQL